MTWILGGERSILLSYGDNIQMSNEFSCPNHPFNSTLFILFYQTHQGMSSKTPAKIIQKSKSKDPNLPAPPKLQSFPTLGITSI